MTSTFSSNKRLELPGYNDYIDSWNVPLNADMSVLDAALGGSTLLSATSPTGTVTLTSTQYRPLSIIVSGSMSADVFYTIPAGVGGQWTVTNGTTGAYSVYMVSAAGGASVKIPQGYSTIVSCDGSATGMRLSINTPVAAAGSNTQVQYNSSGSFAGSSNLTFNGTTLTAAALSLGSALSVPNGGTGSTALTANNVLLGNGTSAVQVVAPGTSGNVLVSNGTTWVSSGAPVSPTNGFRRNRIINGAMQVDQRNNGAAQTITGPSGVIYTVDRWVVQPTGASVTGQRVAGPTGYQYAYQITGASGVTAVNIQQRIESYNVADLANQNVTLSANISNSTLTSVTWTAYYANSVDNWTAATQIATGTFTVSSTATTYSATFNAGANAANGILIQFSVGAQTSGSTWTITGVQLEPGSYATPFERLPIGETLLLCQRYFTVMPNSGTFGPSGSLYSTTSGSVFFKFPVTMRAAPTLSGTSTAFEILGLGVVTGTVANTSFNVQGLKFDGTSLSSSGTIGMPLTYEGTGFINAELQ